MSMTNTLQTLGRLIAALLLLQTSAFAHGDIAVIVNPKNPLAELSAAELKKIFLGRMPLYPNSNREIRAIDLPDENPLFGEFYRQVVDLDGVDLKRYRAYYLFSGRGRLPVVANTAEDVIQKVAEDQGAIGYIDGRDVTPDTRVLMMLPSEAGD